MPSTYGTWGCRGTPPCASGTNSAREAGACGPYVPYGGPGLVRVSSGAHARARGGVALVDLVRVRVRVRVRVKVGVRDNVRVRVALMDLGKDDAPIDVWGRKLL